jgi:hypothetical protein
MGFLQWSPEGLEFIYFSGKNHPFGFSSGKTVRKTASSFPGRIALAEHVQTSGVKPMTPLPHQAGGRRKTLFPAHRLEPRQPPGRNRLSNWAGCRAGPFKGIA